MESREDINTSQFIAHSSGAVSWPGHCYWGKLAVMRAAKAAGMRMRRPLVITDRAAWNAGATVVTHALAETSNHEYQVFDGVVPNPSLAQVRAALQLARKFQCQSIVAVGGGSVIDVAKVVYGCLCSGLEPDELATVRGQAWLEGAVSADDLLLLAIPTTAGTGSESSSAALIQGEDGRKHLYRSLRTRPAFVALQPELTLSLPFGATAQGGFDAALHALGAWVNTDPSPIGKAIALHALRVCMRALPAALDNPDSLSARSDMQMGAYLAGVAIGICKVDAVHAMCTPLESRVKKPHAEVLAPLFRVVSRYTIQTDAQAYADAARLLGFVNTRDDHQAALSLIEKIEQLAGHAHISLHFEGLSLSEQDGNLLAHQALKSASMPLNPRALTHRQISSLYLQMVA